MHACRGRIAWKGAPTAHVPGFFKSAASPAGREEACDEGETDPEKREGRRFRDDEEGYLVVAGAVLVIDAVAIGQRERPERAGEGVVFREYVDVNVAVGEGAKTIIGSNNLFMVYVHVAHNCVIHDRVILANCATLAGHVTLEKNAILGGLAGVHQFVKVGTYSMIGGLSKITMDVMPYCTADGRDEIKICGLNTVGLTRAGFDAQSVSALKKAYKIFFRSKLTKNDAIAKICETIDVSKIKLVSNFVEFAKNSERGILR